MKKYLLIFFILFCTKAFFSQNGWNAFTGIIPGIGIAGNETCMSIDKYGNKWIGFSNANANSAVAFAKYNVASGSWLFYSSTNTPVIPNNHINAIACDTTGNVWIGTNAGLLEYNGLSFTLYTTSNGLPSNSILSLECSGNMVFVGTNAGLSRYNGSVFYNYSISNSLLCTDTITSIKAQSPTQIWLGGYNKLIELNFNTAFTSSYYNLNSIPFSSGKINSIFIDGNSKKWMGTYYKGLVSYDNVSFEIAATTYSDIIGITIPSNCLDVAKGPKNGALIYANCASYSTPSGSASVCLLELLPNKNYCTYYIPNSNYWIGNYVENGSGNDIFLSNKTAFTAGNFSKFMYVFHPGIYNPYDIGPGMGVNNDNFKYLDVNRVSAGIANRGDMFWDVGGFGYAKYEVPKGSNTHSGFCKDLWIGGLDASNQLHIASQTYRQTGCDFWPGPIDTTNVTCDSATFVNYDKIWKINYTDINDFILNFQNGNIANNTYTPSIDIITWPAKGTGNLSRNLAPFIDVNNNGIYDPLTGGDYPQIKGDQTLFFIYNDVYKGHSESHGAPLGLEIHCMAYAYGCPNFINGKNELAYTTFYNYKVYNRSNTNYHDMKFALYDDADLGNYNDDYIGCHVQSNLGFSYNADGFDENNGGVNGYQNYPPAVGSCILKGPAAPLNDGKDNDNDGLTDEIGEECLMNEFVYYNNSSLSPVTVQPPSNPNQFFNYMNALWKDSTSFTCGGNAYGGTTPTSFVYPWAYYPGMACSLWSDAVNPKGDRKHIISMGPFNLNAKQNFEVEFAEVWSVDSSSANNNYGAVTKLISDAQKVTAFYKSQVQSTCLPSMAIGIKELESNSIGVTVFPNPVSDHLFISTHSAESAVVEIHDVFGHSILKTLLPHSNNFNLDVNSLLSGVYFISVTQNNTKVVKKFVKE